MTPRSANSASRLLRWLEANDYGGYDPFDGLGILRPFNTSQGDDFYELVSERAGRALSAKMM